MSKLTSRKFWISVAAFLASIATSISGLAVSNDKIVIVGVVCSMLSAAIYASTTQKVITATTNSREVAQAALTDTPVVISEPVKE